MTFSRSAQTWTQRSGLALFQGLHAKYGGENANGTVFLLTTAQQQLGKYQSQNDFLICFAWRKCDLANKVVKQRRMIQDGSLSSCISSVLGCVC